jgi:predicted nucleic acid-binding protein
MRYWDSSALVALHIEQSGTPGVRLLVDGDHQPATWMLSEVEIRSAVARHRREGRFTSAEAAEALRRAEEFWEQVFRITLVDGVIRRAKILLDRHPLRAADALQLASALVAAENDPTDQDFVCLDDRLRAAAALEGFRVLP